MATNEDLIGRSDIDDLEAILSITNTEIDEVIHTVTDNADAIFTWDYEKGARPKLDRLYEKAKTSMWNGQTDLPWDTEVDQEAVVLANAGGSMNPEMDLTGTPMAKWNEKEWIQFGIESQNWTLSQFLHGEQGALVCTAKIVESVPWIDAKYYAATQTIVRGEEIDPDGAIAQPCAILLDRVVRPTAADLSAAVATAPGTELVVGPSDVTVGGRAAKHVELIVREHRGCDPGFFYTWRDVFGGPAPCSRRSTR